MTSKSKIRDGRTRIHIDQKTNGRMGTENEKTRLSITIVESDLEREKRPSRATEGDAGGGRTTWSQRWGKVAKGCKEVGGGGGKKNRTAQWGGVSGQEGAWTKKERGKKKRDN